MNCPDHQFGMWTVTWPRGYGKDVLLLFLARNPELCPMCVTEYFLKEGAPPHEPAPDLPNPR